MIEIRVDVTDLTKVRFGRSALAEVQASLHGLRHPYKHALHRRLAGCVPDDRHTTRFDFLMDIFEPVEWVPDSLMPEPADDGASAAVKQIETIGSTDIATIASDLEHLREINPARWRSADALGFRAELADAVQWYWDNVLSQFWARVESITTAELAYRAGLLTKGGVAAAMSDLSPYCNLEVNTLRISGHSHKGSYVIRGGGIWLIPTVFRWPRLSVSIARDVPVLSYGARGAARLWEDQPAHYEGLDYLLGKTRSTILSALVLPNTTKSLAVMLEMTPGNVSQHLAVLEASGLLASHREGKQVWYERTEIGDSLMAVQNASLRRRRRQ